MSDMQVGEEDFRTFSYEEELEKAKWFKDDLEKGDWKEIHNSPGKSQYWMKVFPNDPFPVKMLFMHETPVPANKVAKILDTTTMDIRKKWNKGFLDSDILETYPEEEGGGWVTTTRVKVSWPFKDRTFVSFIPPTKEIDWFGQKGFLIIQKNAWHDSKPPGEDGFVRATIGGNFNLVITDEKDPTGACKVFALRHNRYNGCMPGKLSRFALRKQLPVTFDQWREGIIEAYNKYFHD